MRGRVPAEETVNDGPAEAHGFARLGSSVEGVVVAVEAVEQGGFEGGLGYLCGVGSATGRGWVIDSLGA
jgi:hypothetical protein